MSHYSDQNKRKRLSREIGHSSSTPGGGASPHSDYGTDDNDQFDEYYKSPAGGGQGGQQSGSGAVNVSGMTHSSTTLASHVGQSSAGTGPGTPRWSDAASHHSNHSYASMGSLHGVSGGVAGGGGGGTGGGGGGGGPDGTSTIATINSSDLLSLKRDREREGRCAECGAQTHELRVDPATGTLTKNPLNVEGEVRRGRCLYCYPLPASRSGSGGIPPPSHLAQGQGQQGQASTSQASFGSHYASHASLASHSHRSIGSHHHVTPTGDAGGGGAPGSGAAGAGGAANVSHSSFSSTPVGGGGGAGGGAAAAAHTSHRSHLSGGHRSQYSSRSLSSADHYSHGGGGGGGQSSSLGETSPPRHRPRSRLADLPDTIESNSVASGDGYGGVGSVASTTSAAQLAADLVAIEEAITRFETENADLCDILASMRRFPRSLRIQELGCEKLWIQSWDDENSSAIGRVGGIPTIIDAMRTHADSAHLQQCGCEALQNLALNDYNREVIAEQGGIIAVIDAMGRHWDVAGVQQCGCTALANIAGGDTGGDNRVAVADCGGLHAILKAVQSFPEDETVLRSAYTALRSLGYNPTAELERAQQEQERAEEEDQEMNEGEG